MTSDRATGRAEPALRVGAASADITAPAGTPMGGYAARPGDAAATGVLDALACRVAVLDDGRTRLVLVVCDLLYVPAVVVARVTAGVAAAVGTQPEQVLVTATHTHCGPAIGDTATFGDLADRVANAARRAATAAAAAAVPADLLLARFGLDGLAQNRRDPADPVDDEPVVVVAVERTSRRPVLTIVNAACHPTVLDHTTVRFSRDYPGAVCDTVEALCGGCAIFLQGFAGDVNPVFTDHSAADARAFGALVGARAGAAALHAVRAHAGTWTAAVSWRETVAVELPGGWRYVEPDVLAAACRTVPVEPRAVPDASTVARQYADATTRLDQAETPAQRRQAAPDVARWWIEHVLLDDPPYIGMDPAGGDATTLPVQVFRLGRALHLVAIPGELFAASARSLRRRLAGRGDVLTAGYANAAVGYLPPAAQFRRSGYEIGSTRFRPGTAERLVDAAADAVADVAEQAEVR